MNDPCALHESDHFPAKPVNPTITDGLIAVLPHSVSRP